MTAPGPRTLVGHRSEDQAEEEADPIEKTGRELRAKFGWSQVDADYTEGSAAR